MTTPHSVLSFVDDQPALEEYFHQVSTGRSLSGYVALEKERIVVKNIAKLGL
jgi:hypothetical protein